MTGYDAFYSFCRVRSGYSGVVTFVKSNIPTVRAEEGLTGTWKSDTPVGHVGDVHHEVIASSLACNPHTLLRLYSVRYNRVLSV